MQAQRYFVIGGEYADTSFTAPALGAQLEVRGPFSEREAKVCWRELTGKTVDNAMVRYFLKAEGEAEREVAANNLWVVGGEYADTSFTRMAPGKELEVYGPFERWEAALGFWRGMTSKSVDDALVRYDIRENYQPGDSAAARRSSGAPKSQIPATETVSIAVAAAPEKVFAFLLAADNWPKWASHIPKGAGLTSLTVKGELANGVLDHAFVDAAGNAWSVPGRVIAAGPGAVYVMTFVKPANILEAQFAQVTGQADEALDALKRILEAM